MSNIQQSLQRPAPALSLRYVTVWALLATLALAYLALLVVRPDVAERLLAPPAVGSPEDNRGQRALSKALAELRELQQTAKMLERELSDVRSAIAAGEARESAISTRLAAVELALQRLSRPASEPVAAAPPVQPAAPVAATAAPRIEGRVEDRPLKSLREAKPADRPAGTHAVQLASGPSIDAVRLSWQLLLETHKATLGSLEPRIVETPGNPSSFRLIAGPLASEKDADRLCERLRQRRTTCSVQGFSGEPL